MKTKSEEKRLAILQGDIRRRHRAQRPQAKAESRDGETKSEAEKPEQESRFDTRESKSMGEI